MLVCGCILLLHPPLGMSFPLQNEIGLIHFAEGTWLIWAWMETHSQSSGNSSPRLPVKWKPLQHTIISVTTPKLLGLEPGTVYEQLRMTQKTRSVLTSSYHSIVFPSHLNQLLHHREIMLFSRLEVWLRCAFLQWGCQPSMNKDRMCSFCWYLLAISWWQTTPCLWRQTDVVPTQSCYDTPGWDFFTWCWGSTQEKRHKTKTVVRRISKETSSKGNAKAIQGNRG